MDRLLEEGAVGSVGRATLAGARLPPPSSRRVAMALHRKVAFRFCVRIVRGPLIQYQQPRRARMLSHLRRPMLLAALCACSAAPPAPSAAAPREVAAPASHE